MRLRRHRAPTDELSDDYCVLVANVGRMVVSAMEMFVDPPEELLEHGEPRNATARVEFEALGQVFEMTLTSTGIAA